jgi:DNA-binding MurR/RpiR family transcriptional regulator
MIHQRTSPLRPRQLKQVNRPSSRARYTESNDPGFQVDGPGAERVTDELGRLAAVERTSALAEFLARVSARQASFSANDATIAAFLRDNPIVVAVSTADQLARTLGVSKAAIVRFAMRMGYTGFKELREDLGKRVTLPHSGSMLALRPESLEDVSVFVTTKLASDLASLSSFVASVDQRALLRCAELLVQPTATVFVAGERRGFAATALAQRLFSWVRPGVRLWRMEEPGLALALDEIRTGDVVLVFAFRRFARVTGVLLEYAREVGATTILVTETLSCPYVDLADSIVLCPSAGSSAFDSSVPAVFCVEVLAGLMVKLVGTSVDQRIRQLLDSRHASRLEDADESDASIRSIRTAPRARRAR